MPIVFCSFIVRSEGLGISLALFTFDDVISLIAFTSFPNIIILLYIIRLIRKISLLA